MFPGPGRLTGLVGMSIQPNFVATVPNFSCMISRPWQMEGRVKGRLEYPWGEQSFATKHPPKGQTAHRESDQQPQGQSDSAGNQIPQDAFLHPCCA